MVLLLSATLALATAAGVQAAPANAAVCNGTDGARRIVSMPVAGSRGTDIVEVKVNSCKAQGLIDEFGKVTTAAGLISGLGAKWWPLGTMSGAVGAWMWQNQSQVRRCAKPKTGIVFWQVNGVIVTCWAQPVPAGGGSGGGSW